jgi:hypothetical protein
MKTNFIALILFVILSPMVFTAFPSISHACKCEEPPSVEQELERSKAVFSGKVIDIKDEKNNRKILFEVEETWKGADESQIILLDELSSCSLDFFEGASYLVYAHDFQGDLTTNICDRTKDLSSAQEDLLKLGKGSTPSKEVKLQDQLRNPVVNYMYIWLPLVILFALAVFIISKRSR